MSGQGTADPASPRGWPLLLITRTKACQRRTEGKEDVLTQTRSSGQKRALASTQSCVMSLRLGHKLPLCFLCHRHSNTWHRQGKLHHPANKAGAGLCCDFQGPFAPMGLVLCEKLFKITFYNCSGIIILILHIKAISSNYKFLFFSPSDFERNKSIVSP